MNLLAFAVGNGFVVLEGLLGDDHVV